MITATNKRRTYGFIIAQQKWADCDSVVAHIVVREGKHPSPINPRGEGEHHIWDAPKRQHGLALESLELRVYLSSDAKFICTMGPQYDSARFVDDVKVGRMAKTLKRIERYVRKSRMTKAEPLTAGQILEAMGKAIGAKFVAVNVHDRGGWDYASSDWKFLPVKYAPDMLMAVVETYEARRVKEVA